MKITMPLFVSVVFASSSAYAGFVPSVSGELVTELQSEFRSNSDDTAIDNTNRAFARSELAPKIAFTENFYVDGVLVFEPFAQEGADNSGDDIWFDRHGLFAEELKFNFEKDNYAVWAGKFNPGFGTAWDYGRGIWSEDFAEGYEITQKIGLGGSYTYENEKLGNHTLSATSFFADTTALSKGTISGLDKAKLADGGAGNTEDLSSFTVSVDGEKLVGVENLSYHLGYRFLAEQDANRDATTDDESGFAAAVNYAIDVNPDLGFDVLLEYAGIDNNGGTKDSNYDYYTASVITKIRQNWNVTTSYTKREIDATGSANDFDDYLFQLSGGYDFKNGLTADVGYRKTDESNQEADILGFMLRYSKEF